VSNKQFFLLIKVLVSGFQYIGDILIRSHNCTANTTTYISYDDFCVPDVSDQELNETAEPDAN
jgi:hypothetical protein